MKTIKKVMAIFISASALALTVLHWGTTESLGWLVAFAGWIPHCFNEGD
jgi:hypothetical protein